MPYPRRAAGPQHAFDLPATHDLPPLDDNGRELPTGRASALRFVVGTLFFVVPLAIAMGLVVGSAKRSVPMASLALMQGAPGGVDVPAPDVEPAGDRPSNTPRSVEQMLDLEAQIRESVLTAVPATVGMTIGFEAGSGVIVSPEGVVLTAGHVSGEPGRPCEIILSDGTVLAGRTLGRIANLDAGMAIVVDDNAPDPLPFAPIGTSANLETGTWTVATGHPGGYEANRPPVVRVGRVNAARSDLLQTDNTLVGGDSGGPLFDLQGHVIGIHSRIGDSLASNVHVPIDQYVANWSALAAGEDQGGFEMPGWMARETADDGVRLDLGGRPDSGGVGDARGDDGRPGATIYGILGGSPAAVARPLDEGVGRGLAVGDRILQLGPFEIGNEGEMLARRPSLQAGEPMTYVVDRDGRRLRFEVVPASASEAGRPDGFDRSRPPPYAGVLGVSDPVTNVGGAAFQTVRPGSPADQAGLRPGDIITSARGVRVDGWGDLIRLMQLARGGDRLDLRVRGPDGVTRDVQVTLANASEVYPERGE